MSDVRAMLKFDACREVALFFTRQRVGVNFSSCRF